MSYHGTSRPDANISRPAVSFNSCTLSTALLTHLADALSVPDGGFSINVRTRREVKAGYAVALYRSLERRIAGRVVNSDILSYIAEHEAVLAQPHVILGGWRSPHDEFAYLDISIVVPSRQFALLLGAACGQTAIWDFEHRESVAVYASTRRMEPAVTSLTPVRIPAPSIGSRTRRGDVSRFAVLLGRVERGASKSQADDCFRGGAR